MAIGWMDGAGVSLVHSDMNTHINQDIIERNQSRSFVLRFLKKHNPNKMHICFIVNSKSEELHQSSSSFSIIMAD